MSIRTRVLHSPVGLVATVAVAAAVLVGGTAGAVRLTAGDPTTALPVSSPPASAPTGVPATADPTPTATAATPSASGAPSAAPSRASRGTARTPASRPATPTAQPTTSRPSGAGQVVQTGTCGASFYSEPQPTASGEAFDAEALTAAHKTLPFNTRVRVINPNNGRSVIVRINDRGPYIDGRCLDLSRAAFRAIAALDLGVLTVRYEILSGSGS